MAKKKKNKAIKSKKKKFGWRFYVLAFAFLVLAILFLPIAILLVLGLLPTFVAWILDSEPGKNKTLTVGSMNFAGCFPYLMGIWKQASDMTQAQETAMQYLSDPMTIVVIYTLALLGYIINFAVTMGVSAVLVEKSRMRIKKIEEEKKSLEKRWGKEVSGMYELDAKGFRVHQDSE